MKKISIVLLVLVLSSLSLYASFNIGAGTGYGFRLITNTYNSDTVKYRNNGFTGDITLGYDFNDYWGVRGKVNLNYYGKTSINGITRPEYINSGLAFDLSTDAVNTYPLNSSFDLVSFFGIKMTQGYLYKEGEGDDRRTHYALGLNAGGEIAYNITNSFSLRFGLDFAWLFVARSPWIKPSGSKAVVNTYLLRAYIGTEYSF